MVPTPIMASTGLALRIGVMGQTELRRHGVLGSCVGLARRRTVAGDGQPTLRQDRRRLEAPATGGGPRYRAPRELLGVARGLFEPPADPLPGARLWGVPLPGARGSVVGLGGLGVPPAALPPRARHDTTDLPGLAVNRYGAARERRGALRVLRPRRCELGEYSGGRACPGGAIGLRETGAGERGLHLGRGTRPSHRGGGRRDVPACGPLPPVGARARWTDPAGPLRARRGAGGRVHAVVWLRRQRHPSRRARGPARTDRGRCLVRRGVLARRGPLGGGLRRWGARLRGRDVQRRPSSDRRVLPPGRGARPRLRGRTAAQRSRRRTQVRGGHLLGINERYSPKCVEVEFS